MPTQIFENTWNPVKLGQKQNQKGGYQISTYEVTASWYNAKLANTGDRMVRLQRYQDMDKTSVEIGRALDILAEDISSSNADDEDVFNLKYPDDSKIQKTAIRMMEAALEIWQKRTKMEDELFNRVRDTLKFGATFYLKNPDGTLKKLDAERMVGYIIHPDDDSKVTHYLYDPSIPLLMDRTKMNKTQELNRQNNKELIPYNVSDLVIFKIGDGAFGESILERVYTVWRQMTLLEDAVVIYRVVRAPERRVYYIDVGNLQGPKREGAIEKQRMRLMQKQSNKKGQLTTDYDPHSTSEDIFIPTNSTGKGSRVETLQGGGNLGELSDLSYFGKKLAAGLRIPFSMIDTQGTEQQAQHSDMRVGQIYAIEMRYMGFVRRNARCFAKVLDENFKDFCIRREISVPDGMELGINPPMSFAIYKDMELQQSKLNIFMSTTSIPSMSKRFAMQEYLHMDHDELVNNEQDKMREFGLTEEQIKKMPPEHVTNIVYGDGRLLSKYGIEAQEDMGGFR